MTLRKAIAQAQATPDDDTIVFADDISVIHLTQGKLWLGPKEREDANRSGASRPGVTDDSAPMIATRTDAGATANPHHE